MTSYMISKTYVKGKQREWDHIRLGLANAVVYSYVIGVHIWFHYLGEIEDPSVPAYY